MGIEKLQEDSFFALKVGVERFLGVAGALRNEIDRRALITVPYEQLKTERCDTSAVVRTEVPKDCIPELPLAPSCDFRIRAPRCKAMSSAGIDV